MPPVSAGRKGAVWRRVRLEVLRRDGYVCQIRGPHCTVLATEADHIRTARECEVSGNHATPRCTCNDPRNLRAACKPCNSGRENNAGRTLPKPKPRPKHTRWW